LHGAPAVTSTTYERDEEGRVVAAVTVTEPEWSDVDRGLLLALLAERKDTCPNCGHLMSVCRDVSTAGTWTVVEDVCQPSRVAQAAAENLGKRRGVVLSTRRS